MATGLTIGPPVMASVLGCLHRKFDLHRRRRSDPLQSRYYLRRVTTTSCDQRLMKSAKVLRARQLYELCICPHGSRHFIWSEILGCEFQTWPLLSSSNGYQVSFSIDLSVFSSFVKGTAILF